MAYRAGIVLLHLLVGTPFVAGTRSTSTFGISSSVALLTSDTSTTSPLTIFGASNSTALPTYVRPSNTTIFPAALGWRPYNKTSSITRLIGRDHEPGHGRDFGLLFDPFNDLEKEDTKTLFPSVNSKKLFYELTDANIQASRVIDWYSEWSVARQASPGWESRYEWEEFAWNVAQKANFMCTLTNEGCQNSPSLYELEQTFTDYPHHVRRVYFVTQMFELLQAHQKSLQTSYMQAQLALIDLVPEIVDAMQMQQDYSRAALCTLLHELIQVGVQLVTSAAASWGDGLIDKIAESSQTMSVIVKNLGEAVRESAELLTVLNDNPNDPGGKIMTQGWAGAIRKVKGECLPDKRKLRKGQNDTPCGAMTSTIKGTLDLLSSRAWGGVNKGLMGYVNSKPGVSGGEKRYGNPWDTVRLDAAKGNDPMCSNFEGDVRANGDKNIKELKRGLTVQFTNMREILTQAFEDFYGGSKTNPGHESWTAEMLANTKWTGPSSLVKDMHMYTAWQKDFELQMAMQAASVMAAQDYSHIICTRTPDSSKFCASAASASPCTSPGNCMYSVFCPEADIVCKAQKWYPTVTHTGHMTMFPSGPKWSQIFGNRFGLTQTKVLLSAWESYKAYKNEFGSIEATWGTKKNEAMNIAGGFRLPLCFREGLDINQDWFPVSCGNWRSSETEGFMAAAFMGPKSKVFNEYNGDKNTDFVDHVLPATADWTMTSPLGRYLNYCALGIRFATTSDTEHPVLKFRAHKGRDQDCDLIAYSTGGMDENTANEWFCNSGRGEHTVFQREERHIAMWTRYAWSHRIKCDYWSPRKGQGGVPDDGWDGLGEDKAGDD